MTLLPLYKVKRLVHYLYVYDSKLLRAWTYTNGLNLIGYVHNSQGVGETGTLFPAGYDDDRIAGSDEAFRFAELDTGIDSGIDVS